MTDTIARDAGGAPLTKGLDHRDAGADDFPPRTIETVGDLGTLLADYAGQCDRELNDISLAAFWPALSAIVLATMDNDAARRNAMRTEFFTALAARIRAVRQLHVHCDAYEAAERKRQAAATRRAANQTRENAKFRARISELEAELERRSVTWPRAVGE
ncbi:hypothetical protein [Bradyrhizobium sp. S3.5.5]|uniref:hypothetical protein n=1 Tax=Bradyrhizobium sp. S3.5.5 TaxID=3156430 RepID=UPI003393E6E2